ncbi:hypothetical protein [Pedobacter frigidisoli]|uniref:hypothetical protein n=1 Tax=Pedobacter frigidisoli TaxID=2530455 RepID=UPI00292DCA3F|nr:hypothetical protein [Pedobacter frigidisoli]
MLSNFEIKRLFDNDQLIIVEIKIAGSAQELYAADQYEWFYLEKNSKALIKLWLNSRDSSPAVEERFFEQSYLKFNRTQATYIEKYNSAQHTLSRQASEKPHSDLLTALDGYHY